MIFFRDSCLHILSVDLIMLSSGGLKGEKRKEEKERGRRRGKKEETLRLGSFREREADIYVYLYAHLLNFTSTADIIFIDLVPRLLTGHAQLNIYIYLYLYSRHYKSRV